MDQGDSDRTGGRPDPGAAEPRSAFDLAFADLSAAPAGIAELGEFRARQIGPLIAMTPVMASANLLTAAAFAVAVDGRYRPELLLAWIGPMALLSLLILARWWPNRGRRPETVGPGALRKAELYAALFGATWALFPALFFDLATANLRILITGITLAAVGIGAFTLAAVPSAAIIFSLIIAGSLAMVGFNLGGTEGMAFGALALVYGGILATIILTSHRLVVREAQDARALAKQREIISLLLHDFEAGASDWLWEIDAGGRLVYCSNRLADVTGLDRGRLLGATLLEAAGAGPDGAGWAEALKLMDAQADLSHHEVAVRRPEANSTWQLTARPLLGRSGEFLGYRGAGRDVTQSRRAQDELIRAKTGAERASEAKSQFLAVISHELKTPLNAIIGFSSMLAARDGQPLEPHAQVDYARMVHESGVHLRSLIEDVLDVSRIERGAMRMVEQEADAADIAEVAAKMCRDAAAANDTGIVATLTDNLEILGDITRMKQVLINLITNAIKFSTRGGTVELTLEREANGGAVFTVKDGGIGVAPADLERIFEPFVQADLSATRRFGGLGLGLPIARSIARMHGGDVTLESLPGSGTTARFTLPAARVREVKTGEMRAVA